MSLRDVSMFYVLGEDAAHRSFIRSWLDANGVHGRRIHTIDPPADKSGGIWLVLTKCGETVREARVRDRSRAKTRVIIAIDADDRTVQERLLEIERAIEGPREDAWEVMCVLVPKRHIETWVHALGPSNPVVNEQDDYKHKSSDEVKAAGRRLAKLPGAPQEPPSLLHGHEQLQRLKNI